MTTGTQITPLQQVCQGLQKMQTNFEQSLPKGLSADRFIRTATNAIQMHPQKDKLLQANRQSLYNSCQKAAIDGLMLDGREAALVVFGTDVTYMPMTQGLVKLARNSGEIETITSEVVYEGDQFTCFYDVSGTSFKHEPNWTGDRGAPVMVWAAVKLKSGEVIVRALAKDKIMKIAGKSKNSFQYDPDKGPFFDEWWRKTAIKNVLKYAPKSTELEKALIESEGKEFGEPEPEQTAPAAPKQTRAAKVVKEPEPEQEAIDAEIVDEQTEPEQQEESFPGDDEEIPV